MWFSLVGSLCLELRRWPREAKAAIAAALPATQYTAGESRKGTALPIASARIKIQDFEKTKTVNAKDHSVTFDVTLEAGRTHLQTWFNDKNEKPICGAYYVYVRRK